MISRTIITEADKWLDGQVAITYQEQTMAQDWARVTKVVEEIGEAIAELILYTGQNPRKPIDEFARGRMLAELGDTALTAILAIQHFTKDAETTAAILGNAQAKIRGRVPAEFKGE